MRSFILLLSLLLAISTLSFAQFTAEWKATGPIQFPTNISGQIHGIGRTTQIKFDPIDENTIWATTASGGLYVSHNEGLNWQPTGTEALPPLNCASVCIDYSDNNIIYLGTGDPNYYYESYGVYKSTDGGSTWNDANAGMGYLMAVELLMDPADNNVLLAATNGGIYKTYDGGDNWELKGESHSYTDMIYKPDSSGVVYAVSYDNYLRSDNWGETWTNLTYELELPGEEGDGMRIGVSKENPEVVYIASISGNCTVFKSTDAGLSFETVKTGGDNLAGYSADEYGQGNYNFDITADPQNANKVYVVAHVVWRSDDGGETWNQYTEWWADCHTDMHQIVHNPHDNSMIFNANDGGIFLSYDEGDTWTEYANGLSATEIYHAAQSNLERNLVSIGTQDNGELYYGDSTWYCNRGGDWGSRMFFDYLNYNRVYYYYGYRRIVTGGDESWNAPFSNADAGPVRMAFTPLQPEMGYCSQFEIWRTDNLSSGFPYWQQLTTWNNEVRALAISPVDQSHLWAVRDDGKICRTYNATDASPDWEIFSAPAATNYVAGISVYKSDESILYMFSYSDVYRSSDGGETWSNVSDGLPDINLIWIYIDDYSDDESVYVANANGVYYRNNTMNDWDIYSEGLPTVANIQDLMMFNDGSPNSVLRVSYYGKGVWESPLIQPNPIPAADFEADKTVICPGNSIQFVDHSTVNSDSIAWVFEGGTPASSTEEDPVVIYDDPGIYSVTLIASNNNGSDIEIKNSYITVSPVNEIPLTEGFEGDFLPEYWTERDANDDGVFWVLSDDAGGFGTSAHSAMFDNYYQDVAGARDAMVSPIYNLSLATQAMLTFDVAYAMYSLEYPDTLAVLITDDCSETFTEAWMKSDTALATAPSFTDDRWIPEATQWRTETLDLALWLGKEKVAIAFENRGHYGQAVYIDNVNLSGELLTTNIYENDPSSFFITIYPNPIKDIAIASVQASTDKNFELNISNSIGEIVLSKEISIIANTIQTISLDLSKLPAGAYLMNALEQKKQYRQNDADED